MGFISFLGTGSYTITEPSAPTFGWTYASGNVEYWAMNHLFSTTVGTNSTQSPLAPPYSSFNNFVSTVCAMPSPPTTWFSACYKQKSNFCSVNPC